MALDAWASTQKEQTVFSETVRTNPLFLLVGDSKVGKTELSVRMLRMWSRRTPLTYVRTLASRNRRPGDPHEDVVYQFKKRWRIDRMLRAGELVECVEYAGNVYAVSYAEIIRVLETGAGIMAATEDGCRDFADAGLHVVPIRIVAKNRPRSKAPQDPARLAEDAARAQDDDIPYWATVENDFRKGGLSAALAELHLKMLDYVSR